MADEIQSTDMAGDGSENLPDHIDALGFNLPLRITSTPQIPMKQIKTIPAIFLVLLLASCATILPGNDPVLVNAERTTSVAFTTIDSFLALERGQEVYVKANFPQIHTFANNLRLNGQKYLTSARVATEAYRVNRTAENKADLNTAIAILQAILDQIPAYSAQITVR